MNPLEKHRPKTIEEYGASMHATQIVNYVKGVRSGNPPKQIALLYGRSGCGKTTLIRCVAESMNLDLADVNASDDVSAPTIRSACNAAMNGTPMFLDEADRIGKREQAIIARLAPRFTAPVFLAVNDEGKIVRDLRNVALEVEVPRPSQAKLREVGRRVKASPRAIIQAASFRDLVHDSDGGTTGEYTQGEVMAALLGGDGEAGKVSDIMRAEPWILDNSKYEAAPLSFDLWRSRYRRIGKPMEKYARHAASGARLPAVRFPWSLALRGREKRARVKAERAQKADAKTMRDEMRAEDAAALKAAQERAAAEKAVEAVEEWV